MNKKNVRNYRDSDLSGEQNTEVLEYNYLFLHTEKKTGLNHRWANVTRDNKCYGSESE